MICTSPERGCVVLDQPQQAVSAAVDPALVSDLLETHTRKIHLLIIDVGLEDYQHEHPEPTATPGEYRFRFVPRGPGPYRLWANTLPVVSVREEFARADLPSSAGPGRVKKFSTNLTARSDGLRYELQFDGGEVQAGRVAIGRIKIFTEAGVPVSRLEPVMGAFAHFAAFGWSRKNFSNLPWAGEVQHAP